MQSVNYVAISIQTVSFILIEMVMCASLRACYTDKTFMWLSDDHYCCYTISVILLCMYIHDYANKIKCACVF